MKNKKYNQGKKQLVLSVLSLSISVMSIQTYALQAMGDEALRSVNGQDGVKITATLAEANIDQLYWEDQAGRAGASKNALRATVDQVKITKNNTNNEPLKADIKIHTGSNSNPNLQLNGLDLSANVTPALVTFKNLQLCESQVANSCGEAIGNIAIQTNAITNIQLRTVKGLFSKEYLSEMLLGVNNANVYISQTDVNNKINQLVLNNFNFNFKARGSMFIDETDGLIMQTNARSNGSDAVATLDSQPSNTIGYVDLNRVANSASKNNDYKNTGTYGNGKSGAQGETTSSGLNLELMLNQDVDANQQYALNSVTNIPENAKGLIRLGASGRLVNSSLQFRGTKGDQSVLGNANSATSQSTNNVIGDSGIGFRMKAEFTRDNDKMLANGDGKASTLEIGGAGSNAYGFEFSNLTGLLSGTRASFDSGNVYLNLVDSKYLTLPVNQVFQSTKLANGQSMTSIEDYKHSLHNGDKSTNPFSLVTAIRGSEFQTFARRGRFTNGTGIDPTNLINDNGAKNEWGFALPFYNMNANLALFGTKVNAKEAFYYTLNGSKIVKNAVANAGETNRIGFAMAMSVEGVNKAGNIKEGTKTTSILILDSGKVSNTNQAVNSDYYMGLRNIDMFLKGGGNLGFEKGRVNVSLRDMLIVMSAEVAAGYLPGSTYRTCLANAGAPECATVNKVDNRNFASQEDVLFNAKLRIGGDVDLSLIPNNSIADGNSLSYIGELVLKGDNNLIQIADPQDGTALSLEKLSGKLAFENAISIHKDPVSQAGQLGFKAGFTINPDQNIAGVFRARDLTLYPPDTGTAARLGEIAITGGRISTELRITPRN